MFMIQKDQSTRKLLLKISKTPMKALFKYVSLGAKMFQNMTLNHSLSPRHAEGQAYYVFPEKYSWRFFFFFHMVASIHSEYQKFI